VDEPDRRVRRAVQRLRRLHHERRAYHVAPPVRRRRAHRGGAADHPVVRSVRLDGGERRVASLQDRPPPVGQHHLQGHRESNIRLSATRTVARPQLRELAPFVFTEFFGAREILGNPNLDRTRIINLDARFELFPHAGEVIAISAFHKDFDKPIEQVILPTSRGVISYQNAKGAVNTGLEAEARKSLDFVSNRLKDFSLLGNVTVVYSRVDLDQSQIGVQTSNSRPLAGQSPFVINFALDWNREQSKSRARILYNVSGARIASVGSNGLPDIYEQPRHLVDLSFAQGVGEHVDLKATIENLLDAPVRFTQGEDGRFITNRYNVGSTFWLMATYSL
jgi:outer membrane receptor protein involved in Fe transport